jgi:copper chaperone CopZ
MKNAVIPTIVTWMIMTCVPIVHAGEMPSETTVKIEGMHCVVCAKKVTKKLTSVSNVKSANVDPEKGIAVITSLEGKELSPKALWEAVETAGYKPTELKGPAGTFKSKPKK